MLKEIGREPSAEELAEKLAMPFENCARSKRLSPISARSRATQAWPREPAPGLDDREIW
jgi:hypothetical protein